jgi:glycosyltransferase involved in cell wall biosynthesis
MRRLEVSLPCFNEETCLPSNVERLRRFLTERMPEYHSWIHVIDNGSTDRTSSIARALALSSLDVRYTRIEQKGRGRALRRVWMASDAEYLCYMDADLATDLVHLPELLAALDGGADIAYGSRLNAHSRTRRSLYRECLSRSYNLLVRALFQDFGDAQCGFKAINQRVAKELVPSCIDSNWFFDTELLILASERGYALRQIPVSWVQGPRSSVKTVRTSLELLAKAVALRARLRRQRGGRNNGAVSFRTGPQASSRYPETEGGREERA